MLRLTDVAAAWVTRWCIFTRWVGDGSAVSCCRRAGTSFEAVSAVGWGGPVLLSMPARGGECAKGGRVPRLALLRSTSRCAALERGRDVPRGTSRVSSDHGLRCELHRSLSAANRQTFASQLGCTATGSRITATGVYGHVSTFAFPESPSHISNESPCAFRLQPSRLGSLHLIPLGSYRWVPGGGCGRSRTSLRLRICEQPQSLLSRHPVHVSLSTGAILGTREEPRAASSSVTLGLLTHRSGARA